MKSFLLFLVITLLIASIAGCKNPFDSDKTKEDNPGTMPVSFPLEVGNAWVYENVIYNDDGSIDSAISQTLYIAGRYQDYFLHTWAPAYHCSLVKNENEMLVDYGEITQDGLNMYAKPYFKAIYNRTGTIDFYSISEIDFSSFDSVRVDNIEDMVWMDEEMNTIKITSFFTGNNYMETYITDKGMMQKKVFNSNGKLSQSLTIMETLKDTIPDDLLQLP